MLKVKEVFYTLQGEGLQSGRPAVFCRFSGCNLWNGLERGRNSAVCKFCDTDFHGTNGSNGGLYPETELALLVESLWPKKEKEGRMVVLTGGEPCLQANSLFVDQLKDLGFFVAVETNGTVPMDFEPDWICVSPKTMISRLSVRAGDEFKFVYPQTYLCPTFFESLDFDHFLISPMHSKEYESNLLKSIDFVKKNPKWRLSIQSHKYIGVE